MGRGRDNHKGEEEEYDLKRKVAYKKITLNFHLQVSLNFIVCLKEIVKSFF